MSDETSARSRQDLYSESKTGNMFIACIRFVRTLDYMHTNGNDVHIPFNCLWQKIIKIIFDGNEMSFRNCDDNNIL